MPTVEHGRAVYRTYLNLRERSASPARAVFDPTLRVGASIMLAESIRRYTRLSYEQMRRFAQLAGHSESELRLTLMPLLRDGGLIEYTTGPDGEPVEIIERVAVAAPLMEQCDTLWELCGPSPEEAAAVESAEFGATLPMARSDHQAALEQAGFPESLHAGAIVAAEGAGLLYSQPSTKVGEDVLFSPYVWEHTRPGHCELHPNLPPNGAPSGYARHRRVPRRRSAPVLKG
jgi:hypothetical protein